MSSVEIQTETIAVCVETQTWNSTRSVESQTQSHRPPTGFYFVGMFGDSHMKTCYRFLIKLLEGETDFTGSVHDIHKKETVFADVKIGNFRNYHSTYLNHELKLFVEFVFITSAFDSHFQMHTAKHLPVGHDVLFVNSALWDARSDGIEVYGKKVRDLTNHLRELSILGKRNVKMIGLIFNAIDPTRVTPGTPFHNSRFDIANRLRWFNGEFDVVLRERGFSTFCLEEFEPVALASDGIHYSKCWYCCLAKFIKTSIFSR